MKRGDIIVGLNEEEVSSVKQLAVLLEVRGGGWTLSVERGGKVFNLAIQG